MEFSIVPINLPLKVNWKISRNETSEKINLIIHLKYHQQLFLGEVAFNIRYGESLENTLAHFQIFKEQNFTTLQQCFEYLWLNPESLNSSLLCGLEQACIKALAYEKKIPLRQAIIQLFQTQSDTDIFNENKFTEDQKSKMAIPTFYSLPIMPINEIKDYLSKLHHFQYLKIKINALAAEEITAEVMKHKLPNQKILIDGNEAFVSAESFMDYYSHWQNMSDIIVIEQPMPAAVNNEYLLLKKLCLTPLMADESILWQADQLPSLRFSFDYLNIKLMKTGGIIPALKLMNVARPLGFKFMLGCMIETSLSLSYALEVADLFHLFDVDGFLLLKNDPYNLLTEQDGLVYFQKH